LKLGSVAQETDDEGIEVYAGAVLKEHQADVTAADLRRKHGISEATFYTWRSKYGGMEVSDARTMTRH
jgi:transposase-like protein